MSNVGELPLRLEGSTVEHTIEDRRAQVRLLLGTLLSPSLGSTGPDSEWKVKRTDPSLP